MNARLRVDSLRECRELPGLPSGGMIQHVLNRGNGRTKLFDKPSDYEAFAHLPADAAERVPGWDCSDTV